MPNSPCNAPVVLLRPVIGRGRGSPLQVSTGTACRFQADLDRGWDVQTVDDTEGLTQLLALIAAVKLKLKG